MLSLDDLGIVSRERVNVMDMSVVLTRLVRRCNSTGF